MKNLRVMVIAACFTLVLALSMETADLSAYHDLGRLHFDSVFIHLTHAHHSKAKSFPVLHSSLFSLIPPEHPFWHRTVCTSRTLLPVLAFLVHVPSRASPV